MSIIISKSVFFLCFFFVCYLPIYGQKIIIQNNLTSRDINRNVLVYKRLAGVQKIKYVIGASACEFDQNTSLQDVSYGFYHQQGWCKFTVQNNTSQTNFFLYIEQSRADSVRLFVLKPNETIEPMCLLGRHIPIENRIILNRNYVYPLIIPRHSVYTYYLYSSRKFGLHGCILSLKSELNYAEHVVTSSSQLGFIFGVSIITALMGLVLYWFIREKVYFAYSLYCICAILVGLSDAGYVHSYVYLPVLQPAINIATSISSYLFVGLRIWLTIEFLDIKTYKKQWFYLLGKYATLLLVTSAFILLFPIPYALMWWLVYVSYYILFFMDAYVGIAIINGIRDKHPFVYFYMVGFFLTLLLFTILALANLNVLDEINNNVELFYFTPLIEVLVIVYGLVMRFSNSMCDKLIFQKKNHDIQVQMITLQENERTRIAQDLHDDVGNSLAALKTKFFYEKRIDDIQNIQQIIDDLRTITHNIMPPNFQDFELEKMLENLIGRFENHSNITFEFITAGKSKKLESDRELAIYRIINELITNTLKHSRADEIIVQTVYQKECLILSFEDNGQPFSFDKQVTTNNKIGIKSILARLSLIQAQFSFNSDCQGNLLIINIPYKLHE